MPELPHPIRVETTALCERVRAQLGVEVAALCRRYPRHAAGIWQLVEALTGLRRTGEVRPTATGTARELRGGTWVGRYRIIQPLGKGGMGVVYLAEQCEPVRRQVALKVIRAGTGTDQVLARFALERRALAVMSHPNIARVFEAGETSDGTPYFVMEYVPGVPIDEYCDRARLSLADRLILLQQVCAGVQHAHQKGVIHRDLTAKNVLVCEEEGRPVPKIIDFGLARATDLELVQQSMCTEAGIVVGTPEYMSPEQIAPEADIDARTDVYSLGVLGYLLLTGALPFAVPDRRRGWFVELQRRILEDEPPRPSLCVELMGKEAAREVARLRRTTVHHLVTQLRKELDWIALKCLEKDRNCRYQTPGELAAEIGRYLADEPLEAGPPSAGYRLRKTLRRHRKHVAAGIAVAATLIAGMLGTTHGLLAARANARTAEAHAEAAQREKLEADRQRERADRYAQRLQRHTERLRQRTLLALAARLVASDPWLAIAYVREVPEDSDLGAECMQVAYDALSSCAGRWGCVDRLTGHDARVTSLALSPDGSRALTSSSDGTARVWPLGGGAPHVLPHPDEVRGAAFLPRGLGVLTDCRDGIVRLWSGSAGGQPTAFAYESRQPRRLVLDPIGTRFVTIAADGTARVYDIARPAAAPRVLAGRVRTAAFSPDGQRLLVLGVDGVVRLIPADGGGMEREVVHQGGIAHACFSPDGARVLTAGADGAVKLSAVRAVGQPVVLQHPGPVTWGEFSADGASVITLAADHVLRVWPADGGAVRLAYQDGDAAVTAAVVSDDRSRCATIGADHVVRVWHLGTSKPPVLLRHESAVAEVRFVGEEVLTVGADKRVCLFTLAGEPSAQVLGHSGSIELVAAHGESGRVLTAAGVGPPRIWVRGDPIPPETLPFASPATALAASATGLVAVGQADGRLVVVDAATGSVRAEVAGHGGSVRALAFGAGGAWLASGAEDGSVIVTGTDDWQPRRLGGGNGAVAALACSPDGALVACARADGSIEVLRADGTGCAITLRGHTWHVDALAFAPDGRTLASASWDGTVRLWPVGGDAEPAVLRHPDKVHSVAFAPDGARVATACADGVARVFKLADPQTPVRLTGHTRAVRALAFAPDGRRIATAAADHTVRVFAVDGSAPPIVLRGHGDEVVSVRFAAAAADVILSAALDGSMRVWPAAGAGTALALHGPRPMLCAEFAGDRVAIGGGTYGLRAFDLDWPSVRAMLRERIAFPLTAQERLPLEDGDLAPAPPPR